MCVVMGVGLIMLMPFFVGVSVVVAMFVLVTMLVLMRMLVLVALVHVDQSARLDYWRTARVGPALFGWTSDEAGGFRLIIVFGIELWLDGDTVNAVLVHLLPDDSSDNHVIGSKADQDMHGRHCCRFR